MPKAHRRHLTIRIDPVKLPTLPEWLDGFRKFKEEIKAQAAREAEAPDRLKKSAATSKWACDQARLYLEAFLQPGGKPEYQRLARKGFFEAARLMAEFIEQHPHPISQLGEMDRVFRFALLSDHRIPGSGKSLSEATTDFLGEEAAGTTLLARELIPQLLRDMHASHPAKSRMRRIFTRWIDRLEGEEKLEMCLKAASLAPRCENSYMGRAAQRRLAHEFKELCWPQQKNTVLEFINAYLARHDHAMRFRPELSGRERIKALFRHVNAALGRYEPPKGIYTAHPEVLKQVYLWRARLQNAGAPAKSFIASVPQTGRVVVDGASLAL